MQFLNIASSPLNIQKLQLTADIYNEYANAKVVTTTLAASYRTLNSVHLHEDSCLKNIAFIDKTVIVPQHGWTQFDINEIKFTSSSLSKNEITAITAVKEVEIVNATIVYNTPKHVAMSKNNSSSIKLVKNFLKQIFIVEGCMVFCSCLPELNIFAIIINKISGKPCGAAKTVAKSQLYIDDVLSFDKYKAVIDLPRLSKRDSLFLKSSAKATVLHTVCRVVGDVIDAYSGSLCKPDNKILLVGPSGCGKTSLVSAIARQKRRILLKLDCGDMNDSSICNKLTELLGQAKEHVAVNEPTVVLISNVDRLCTSRQDKSNKKLLLIRQIAFLIADISEVNISIVATTNAPEQIHPYLKRTGCFNQEIEMPILTEHDRYEAFRHLTDIFGIECSETLSQNVVRWTPGFLLADIESVLRNTVIRLKDSEVVTEDLLKKSVSKTQPSLLRGTRGLITTHTETFADIGGLIEVKEELKRSILWQLNHPEAFERLGIQTTKGILLYGPPGCAKTTLVKALAAESGATFIAASAADLYSPYVGESEKRICKLFSQARIGAPSIVFIDEIDALVGSKGANRESGVQERILATLLMEMDGVGVNLTTSDSLIKINDQVQEESACADEVKPANVSIIVVGATNRPDLLDDALKRPGRFDKLIHIPLPVKNERFNILQSLTSKMQLDIGVDLEQLAEKTDRFSGADLKHLCAEAAMHALTLRGMATETVTQSDFYSVLDAKNYNYT